MSANLGSAWPPIITDARVPRAVLWRDRIMTIAMWLLLLYLMRRGLILARDEMLELLGRIQEAPQPPWALIWARLEPYLAAAGLLGLWLLAWGVVTLRRIRRLAGTQAPPPLSLAEQARDAGCSAADLARWRELRVMVVDSDELGRLSVVPGGTRHAAAQPAGSVSRT